MFHNYFYSDGSCKTVYMTNTSGNLKQNSKALLSLSSSRFSVRIDLAYIAHLIHEALMFPLQYKKTNKHKDMSNSL